MIQILEQYHRKHYLNRGRLLNLIIQRGKKRFHATAAPYKVVLNFLGCQNLMEMTHNDQSYFHVVLINYLLMSRENSIRKKESKFCRTRDSHKKTARTAIFSDHLIQSHTDFRQNKPSSYTPHASVITIPNLVMFQQPQLRTVSSLKMKLFLENNLTLVTLVFPLPFKSKTDFAISNCEQFEPPHRGVGVRR